MSDTAKPPARHRLAVEIEPGSSGHPDLFALVLGHERTALAPGKSWPQTDHFKWATRGILEAPQSFAVHPDGSVDYNGETFRPTGPDAAHSLEKQINRRHPASTAPAPKPPARPHHDSQGRPSRGFRLHLDHLGHIQVQAFRGSEHTETGLRGLAHLAVDGWMRPPQSLHIDPLQRYLELDGVRFENNADGAQRLEDHLNAHFIPAHAPGSAHAIEIRENPAASTGFDIRFWTVRAGARTEVKGHLSQEKLEILQDRDKCDLLQPGILLRVSPPFLYIRRRQHDGSEEPIAGLPDIKYRGVSASELERVLNHPRLRNPATLSPTEQPTAEPAATPAPEAAAPQPLPNHKPVPFNPPLKSPPPRAASRSDAPAPEPPAPSLPEVPAIVPPSASTDVLPPPFNTTAPGSIHELAFRELAHRLHFPVQDLLLSLPRVFQDRRFEILDFNGEEISSVLQLRTDHFYGFYLTHLGPGTIDLVYACHGTHLEWGTHKCTVQPTVRAETAEFRGPALLGLAQNRDQHFVFIVDPQYRAWVQIHEKVCLDAYAHFLTPTEWALDPDSFPLIWPIPA